MEVIKTVVGLSLCLGFITCTRRVSVDFCTKKGSLPDFKQHLKNEATNLNGFVNLLKDFKEKLDVSKNIHENQLCGYQDVVIMHEGIEDFYKSKRDTKRLRLPRKRRARLANEIQWMLTAVAYNLKAFNQFIQQSPNNSLHTSSEFVRENNSIFSKLATKSNVIGEVWATIMFNLKLRSKKRKSSCCRRGCIPGDIPFTEKYACKKGAMLLRDVKCTIDHLIDLLQDCRIKNKNKKSRKGKRGNKSPRIHCSKAKRTAFYSTRRHGTDRLKHQRCAMPKKRVPLWYY